MDNLELFDRLFDAINESEFEIDDIIVNEDLKSLDVILNDGSKFTLVLSNHILAKK